MTDKNCLELGDLCFQEDGANELLSIPLPVKYI